MLLEDGRTRVTMGVTPDGRGKTSARTSPRAFFVSRDQGQAFAWVSEATAAVDGSVQLALTNLDPQRELEIELVRVGGLNAGRFTVRRYSGTAAGTAVVGTNLNLKSDVVAQASAFGNANAGVTGLTPGVSVGGRRYGAAQSEEISFGGALIIGVAQTIGIAVFGTAGPVEIVVRGLFESPEA